jgi:single-strand DNA-binding protein
MSIVHIAGRLGRDAEVRHVGDNDVCNFSVAETIGFGERRTTQWWNCALWGARGAKLSPYLTKGSPVTVCGEVSVREYDGKDGTRKWELTCRVLDVALQGSREDGGGQERQERTPSPQSPAPKAPSDKGEFDDDIPF